MPAAVSSHVPSSPRFEYSLQDGDSEGASSSPRRSIPVSKGASASGSWGKKRPARLDIPSVKAVVSELGLETCRSSKRVERKIVMEERGAGYYDVCCKKGRRGCMEDRFSAYVDIQSEPARAFFGVYDGHGGSEAAEFASMNLPTNVMAEVSSLRDDQALAPAVRSGYLTTDMEFLKECVDGGACCVTALIYGEYLAVSNAGDCRAVLSNAGTAEALTMDHQPWRIDEKSRIECLGGYVDCYRGVWRLQGSLAVTRGIGDRNMKKWVIPDPETQIVRLHGEHEFLVLASDGLWDKVSNQEAVDTVRPLCVGCDNPDTFLACKMLTELAFQRGSMDDVTVLIIQLRRFLQ